MKKRLISLALAVILALGMFTPASAANYTSDCSGTADSVIALAEANLGCNIYDFGWNADWCAYFVAWVGRTAGANFPPNTGAVGSVRYLTRWFVDNNAGTLYYFKEDAYQTLTSDYTNPVRHPERCVETNRYEFTPRKGDIIINYSYGSGWDHTGFVTSYSDGIVYTIEGNTSASAGAGRYCYRSKVATRSRNYMNTNYANGRNEHVIMAILRPDYNEAGNKLEKITTPTEAQKAELGELLFNANVYYNHYEDLRNAFSYDPAALRDHWETNGKAEGRKASALFDADYYLERYPDIAAAFGRENNWWALWHFVNFGFWEGRQGSPYFCAETYLGNYEDLRAAFGANQLEAAKHYTELGIKEGRVASADGTQFNATWLDEPQSQQSADDPYWYSDVPTRDLYYNPSYVMTGSDVKWVQAALNLYGNYGLDIDGSYGPETQKATRNFQRSVGGLSVDGDFGPLTRAEMVSWLASKGYCG